MIRRPIAHRGLHDAASGIIENTASAFAAAVAGNYGIELDVQLCADGVPVVFHDETLDRLTQAQGPVRDLSAETLRGIPLKGTQDRILPLTEVLDTIAGRVPVFIEMKSHFDGDHALAWACAGIVSQRNAPLALMSFDPAMVAALRNVAPAIPRGIVAERKSHHAQARGLGTGARFAMAHLLHWPRTCFHFVAYRVHDLDAPALRVVRAARIPVLTWTVRTQQDRQRASAWADQMIFEGFVP